MNEFLKIWYKATMEYYSTMQKNTIMLFTGQWMEPETIMFSDVSQTQQDKYHCLICFLSYVGHEYRRETNRSGDVGEEEGKGKKGLRGSRYDQSRLNTRIIMLH